ncbi:uncharacterized protein PAC_06817 [Phialocephala subalpina]|uniref:Uncharacterized protein n=1 Tax=Phialocephala subalpina TaxID=576137 RepID=A0A1L7WVX6_9HELO|nr:uncharacterized protein PAC_06817 [Phialocephala subalpina]
MRNRTNVGESDSENNSCTELVQDAYFLNNLENSNVVVYEESSSSWETVAGPDTMSSNAGSQKGKVPVENEMASPSTVNSRLVCTWPGCHVKSFSRPCELKTSIQSRIYAGSQSVMALDSPTKRDFNGTNALEALRKEAHLSLHIENRHQGRLNAQDFQSVVDRNFGTEPCSSMNNDRLYMECPRDEERGSMYTSLGTSALRMKLQEREAERNELASVQAHVEKEIGALKMALDILNK